MKKRWLRPVLIMGAIALLAALIFQVNREHRNPAYVIDPSDKTAVDLGRKLYATHCAACHGANLEGQAEWRRRLPSGRLPAPPHDETGHTWHHPDPVLIDIVKNGLVPGRTAPAGYQSDMPAYRDRLSEAEVIAVLAYIKSTWPPSLLEIQKEVTLEQSR